MNQFLIEGGRPLNGSVTPSGNKNEALPAVVACLLTDEPIILKRCPAIEDILVMGKILEKLGVEVSWNGPEECQLWAKNVHTWKPDAALCTQLRASILFLGPLLSRFGKVELAPPGGDVIGARRLDTHFEGIETLGGTLEFGNPIRGSLPRLECGHVYLDEPSVTATENLLLMSVIGDGTTVLHNAACEPHVSGLCRLLNAMGARITGIGSNRLRIKGVAKLHGATHTIGPDFMEVGSFLCLGAISEGTLQIDDVNLTDLRFVLKTLQKIGIHPEIDGTSLRMGPPSEPLRIQSDIGGHISSIYSGPWPAFPTDLMSVSIVAATQAQGNILFHEKMYEGRMFFTDKLLAMGAQIVLCDPHRIVVGGPGPSQLKGARMSSPDVRAGMAMVIAALIAKGKSEIDNIYPILRGYHGLEAKLQSLGAAISRVTPS